MTALRTKTTALVISALVGLLLCFGTVDIYYANSAAPPMMVVSISNAPEDLVLKTGKYVAERKDRPFTDYFIFQVYDLQSGVFSLQVTTGGKSFEIPITTGNALTNYFILDLDHQTLTRVDSLPGAKCVPVLMIVLTLVIEGIVFYLFGYRKWRSWKIFLGVNLVTQGALIIWLSQTISFTNSYAIFNLIFGEVFVFIIEMIAFGFLLREHGPVRRISYVLLANFLSLFLGGYLISVFAI